MEFQWNSRLGIELPCLANDWANYSVEEQQVILHRWEEIRGGIPDEIKRLEIEINQEQSKLDQEDNFAVSCQLNTEISELASTINDLWLWFRTSPSIQK